MPPLSPPPPTPPPWTPHQTQPYAWYKHGTFDEKMMMWPEATGVYGQPAILSGGGFTAVTEGGHGAVNEVTSLHGTREDSSIRFGRVIQSTFSICSVTRYTSSDQNNQKRILNGGGGSWYHGHWNSRAGVAYYGPSHSTSSQNQLEAKTDWLVMCGSNADGDGFGGMLANGVEVRRGSQGQRDLYINAGSYMPREASDFALAEVIIWDRALSEDELRREASRLHYLLLGNPMPLPPPPSTPPTQPPPPASPSPPPLPPSAPWMQTPIVHLDASNPLGYSGANARNLMTGAEWTMKGESTSCNRTTHRGVPVFDMEDLTCYLETMERLPYCGRRHGYTTATWIDWRDVEWRRWRALHQTEGGELLTAVAPRSNRLGVLSARRSYESGATAETEGWSLVVAVGQDTDCTADGGVGGTTTFYMATPSTGPRLVGISDRSPASGRATLYIGGPDKGPGRLAESWAWDHALTPAQIQSLWTQTQAKYVGALTTQPAAAMA
jgi:hypothetical protein